MYRRWRSKEARWSDAVDALVSEIAVPDTGSTREDLLALMWVPSRSTAAPSEAGVMPSLVDAMAAAARLARAVREGFLAGRRSALRVVLERGVERGDLRADLDAELALDVLGGPLFYRLLITGGPLDEQLAEGVAELILRGFAPPRSLSTNPTKDPR